VIAVVDTSLVLSLFILVFLLNSGWAVIPTVAVPLALVATATINESEYADFVREYLPYSLLSVGIFVLMTLGLSAWCRDEATQPDQTEGADAINSTALPAGSET
jgi:ABC-type transport system involved in multi-copper enzyme maturation permease subunit